MQHPFWVVLSLAVLITLGLTTMADNVDDEVFEISITNLSSTGETEEKKHGRMKNNLTMNCSSLANDNISKGCKFWIQGVLLTFLAFAGIIGNTVSTEVVLSHIKVQRLHNIYCV